MLLTKILVVVAVIIVVVPAAIRVWRLRNRRQSRDPRSLPGSTPGPGDAGGGTIS